MLIAASGLLFAASVRQAPARSSTCLKPVIAVSPRAAAAGESVLVTGKGWYEGCQDTIGCSDGGPCPEDRNAAPRYGINLRFRQGTHADALGSVDADANGRFAKSVVIPLWAKSGASVVSADDVASGFMVASGFAAGAAPVALGPSGGGSASAAPVEPLPKTGAALTVLLALGGGLIALALAVRRRL